MASLEQDEQEMSELNQFDERTKKKKHLHAVVDVQKKGQKKSNC